jgi:hypothetical protein
VTDKVVFGFIRHAPPLKMLAEDAELGAAVRDDGGPVGRLGARSRSVALPGGTTEVALLP